MTPEQIHEMNQAQAQVNEIVNVRVESIRSQIEHGYPEHIVLASLVQHLKYETESTRGEFATLYAVAIVKLAKETGKGFGESI